MAKFIKKVDPHDCRKEIRDTIDEIDRSMCGLGSIIECSCGKLYTKSDSQLDGEFWKLTPRVDSVPTGYAKGGRLEPGTGWGRSE